jgi:hypothetical protein
VKRIRLALIGGLTVLVLGGAFALTGGTAAAKVDVCHHTSSDTNPVVVINVSENAVPAHLGNHGGTGPDSVGVDCTGGDID